MKLASIILAISLVAPFTVYFNPLADKQAAAGPAAPAGGEEKITAAEISNMTGIPAEEIIRLKQTGLNWNQVLLKLQAEPYSSMAEDKKARLQTLASEGIGEELIQELTAAGYPLEEVLQAKLLAERVQVQLAGIADSATALTPAPAAPDAALQAVFSNDNNVDPEARLELYRGLAGSYHAADAIALMVKLQETFGGLEQALNEYLLALQLNLDLEDYAADPDAYRKTKEEQLAGKPLFTAITLQSIEEFALERLQEENSRNQETGASTSVPSANGKSSQPTAEAPAVPLPETPDQAVPNIPNVKPANPAEQIMNELKALNPNK
jgi:hypothetical protein